MNYLWHAYLNLIQASWVLEHSGLYPQENLFILLFPHTNSALTGYNTKSSIMNM